MSDQVSTHGYINVKELREVMELLAEVGHPIPPGASANAVVGLLQVTATINTALVSVLSPQAMNALMLLSIVLCAALVLLVEERYRRSERERSGGRVTCDPRSSGHVE